MKIGIIIPTYQKIDGTTPLLLTRALKSIKNQTHNNYEVFLIGDKYENNNEFVELANSIIDTDKIYYENLLTAVEREKYPIGSHQLWCAGGVNASNYGIKIAKNRGLTYICHLDHDDYWEIDHLESIANVIKTDPDAAFICTCATYYNTYLPAVSLNESIIHHLPIPGGVIHSSVCINHMLIPLLYRDVYAEELKVEPSDADMWTRMSAFLRENNLVNHSYLVTKLTCYHPTENQ
jgi:glycosyltransferase involved in cell wall biosynthesis